MLRLLLLSASFILSLLIFQSGFLLKRQEIHVNSTCNDAKIDTSGCWMEKQHSEVVLIIVDALRYDFLQPISTGSAPSPSSAHFRGQMNGVRSLIEKGAAIGTVLADPPTTTLQRIKALTTGTLPTFIDAGDNFSPDAQVLEDNWLAQAKGRGLNVSFFGDDTWTSLYPTVFTRSQGFSSFDINDLDSVDDAVKDLLLSSLSSPSASSTQLTIAHFLGVDHCGHKHGPAHPQMGHILRKMDSIISSTASLLSPDDLLIVLGDHGMTSSGDHGGDSEDETRAGIMVYSPSRHFRLEEGGGASLRQIDLVPTLSLLLGLPIPFSNLGSVIQEMFPEELREQAVALNFEQMKRFANTYASAYSFAELLELASRDGSEKEQQMRIMSRIQSLLRSSWTRFDWPLMRTGMLAMGETVVAMMTERETDGPEVIVRSGCLLLLLSVLAGGSADDSPAVSFLTVVLPLSIAYYLLSLLLSSLPFGRNSSITRLAAVAAVLLHSVSFLSNSFIDYEAAVLRFLLQSIFIVAAASKMATEFGIKRFGKGSIKSLSALLTSTDVLCLLCSLIILRSEPLFHRCREEEVGCVIYYPVQLLGNLSPDAQFWRLLVAVIFVGGFNWWLPRQLPSYSQQPTSSSSADSAPSLLVVGVAISRPAHFAILLHQLTQIVISGGSNDRFHSVANGLAQFVYCCSLVSAGLTLYSRTRSSWRESHLWLVYSLSWPLFLILGDGPAPSLVGLFLLVGAVFRLCPIDSIPWIFSLLIPFAFYSTGHSPTLTAIPWQAAFVGVPGNFFLRAVPALLVLCHLCVSTLVLALSLPLHQSASLQSLHSLVASASLPTFFSCFAAFFHRRHLMVWKIFAPKFIFESVSFIFLICLTNIVVLLCRRNLVAK